MSVLSSLSIPNIEIFDERREALRFSFLKQQGLERETLTPLPMDASKRRYFRFSQGLLMDAPPPHEATYPFHKISDFLRQIGLSVPQIYAFDHTHGFLLVEDFGDMTYRKALEEGISESLLYQEVVKGLSHLHQQKLDNENNFSLYDVEKFLKEVDIFIEWYGLLLSEKDKKMFREIWKEAYHAHPKLPSSFVLRDVLVDNLMWLPQREGVRKCGFIDFQDGLWGPISYDLVSLLEDARRDISPAFAEDMLTLYFQAFPELNRDDFLASYFLWGAQRSTKILGVFSRLAKRDGREKYLCHLPRVRKTLACDLQHPHLKNVQSWFRIHGVVE